MPVPPELRTPRLLLRRWCAADAKALQPVLAENVSHLGPWIPRRVADPAPLAQLGERLGEFSAAFDARREWRYGLFARETHRVLGEVALFPRDASSRVTFEAADRVEIGYWLRADATGQGLATEAARAALHLALSLPGMTRVEIHCDERNAPSAAIPRRLGFQLAETIAEPAASSDGSASRLQRWTYAADARSALVDSLPSPSTR